MNLNKNMYNEGSKIQNTPTRIPNIALILSEQRTSEIGDSSQFFQRRKAK